LFLCYTFLAYHTFLAITLKKNIGVEIIEKKTYFLIFQKVFNISIDIKIVEHPSKKKFMQVAPISISIK